MPAEAAGDSAGHEAQAVPAPVVGAGAADYQDFAAGEDDQVSESGDSPPDRLPAHGRGRVEADRKGDLAGSAKTGDLAGRARGEHQGTAEGATQLLPAAAATRRTVRRLGGGTTANGGD